jgi:hypothetical protein
MSSPSSLICGRQKWLVSITHSRYSYGILYIVSQTRMFRPNTYDCYVKALFGFMRWDAADSHLDSFNDRSKIKRKSAIHKNLSTRCKYSRQAVIRVRSSSKNGDDIQVLRHRTYAQCWQSIIPPYRYVGVRNCLVPLSWSALNHIAWQSGCKWTDRWRRHFESRLHASSSTCHQLAHRLAGSRSID